MFAACDGGIETFIITDTPTEVHAPSLEEIRAALQASNSTGIVVGKSLNAIELPPFRGQSNGLIQSFTCYSMTDLPDWLEFDSANHIIRLAAGQSAVSTEATEAITVTYTCDFGDDLTDSIEFVLNDMDGGGLVDQAESSNATAPLITGFGTVNMDAGIRSALLLDNTEIAPFPSSLPYLANVGFDPTDASDDTADFDGDGLSNAEEFSGAGNIFIPASNADFSNSTQVSTTEYGFFVVGDINQDGNLDFAAVNNNTDEIDVWFGAGDGTFSLDSSYPTVQGVITPHLVDLDEDGDLDLVLDSQGDDGIVLSMLRNDGTGVFGASETLMSGSSPTVSSLVDFDGDGHYDLFAVVIDDDTEQAFYLGDGTGGFTQSQGYSVNSFGGVPSFADFNHDGFVDFFLTDLFETGIGTIKVIFGDENASYGTQATLPIPLGMAGLAVGDINNDGNLDLLAFNSEEAVLHVRLGNGAGLFSLADDIAVDDFVTSSSLADLNGDGNLDLFLPERGSNQIEVFLGDGAGNFVLDETYSMTEPGVSMPGDFDNDGDIDVLVYDRSGPAFELRYFENQ